MIIDAVVSLGCSHKLKYHLAGVLITFPKGKHSRRDWHLAKSVTPGATGVQGCAEMKGEPRSLFLWSTGALRDKGYDFSLGISKRKEKKQSPKKKQGRIHGSIIRGHVGRRGKPRKATL